MKFRKKPVEIEAIQFNTPKDIREFCPVATPIKDGNKIALFLIKTLEEDMQLLPKHWCIKGVQGEFYPCKPDIFEATYEKVEAL